MKEIDIVKRASHINNECLIVLAGNSKVGSEKDSKIQRFNDSVCFSETWRDPVDTLLFNLNNQFSEFHEPGYKNHLGGRPSGGVSPCSQISFKICFHCFFG